MSQDDFAVIIPAYDERENIAPLFEALADAFREHGLNGEIVLVDDGSTDGTAAAAEEAARAFPGRVIVCRHARNRGKMEALLTGVHASSRPWVVFFDADLQYDPADIARLLARRGDGWDIVTGRKVGAYEKRHVSGVYNWLSSRLFDVSVSDLNSIKACRREILLEFPLRHDWHRYLVVLAHARGHRVTEVDVALRPRLHGRAKFDSRHRILPAVGDLLVVWFSVRVMSKPLHFFGAWALVSGALGAALGLVLVVLRGLSVPPPSIGYRPLVAFALFLLVAAIVLFAFGFVAELIAIMRGELESMRADMRRRDEATRLRE